MFERCTSEVRIDKSDGVFVDIMHTNGGNEDNGFLGINAAVGHADFFPNGGHNQAGCGNNNFICSHNEATKIWIDSVKEKFAHGYFILLILLNAGHFENTGWSKTRSL